MRVDPHVWLRLESAPRTLGVYAARPAVAGVGGLLAALSHDGKRHYLVEMDGGDFTDEKSRGVSAVARSLQVEGREERLYVDLECRDEAGLEAFDLVGGEIAELLAQGSSVPTAVGAVLTKWRRFWGQSPAGLTGEEARGLFGELWFLAWWLIESQGPSAVSAWTGPAGSRHDFQWQGAGVEVKSTLSTRGRIHKIHGIDQLSPPEDGQLFLFSLRLREEPASTNSLPRIVDLCRQRLTPSPLALEEFEERLHAVGYSSVHVEAYEETKYRVVEEALFEVRDDFPRLTSASLGGQLPAGVENVEYEINLNSHDHLCVAKSPTDARNAARLSFWIGRERDGQEG